MIKCGIKNTFLSFVMHFMTEVSSLKRSTVIGYVGYKMNCRLNFTFVSIGLIILQFDTFTISTNMEINKSFQLSWSILDLKTFPHSLLFKNNTFLNETLINICQSVCQLNFGKYTQSIICGCTFTIIESWWIDSHVNDLGQLLLGERKTMSNVPSLWDSDFSLLHT